MEESQMWLWFWIGVALLVGIGEVMTTGLFLGTVAVAAVITALTARWLPLEGQMAVFAVSALGGLFLVRPIIVRALGWTQLSRPARGLAPTHLEGKRAVVTRTVDDEAGQIRVGEGEFWSARSYSPDESIPVGTPVEILLADGFIARVSPLAADPLIKEHAEVTIQKGSV